MTWHVMTWYAIRLGMPYVVLAASGSSRSAMRRIVTSWKTPMPVKHRRV